MSLSITIILDSCNDCHYQDWKPSKDGKTTIYFCKHIDVDNGPVPEIIEVEIPDWCPLKKGSNYLK